MERSSRSRQYIQEILNVSNYKEDHDKGLLFSNQHSPIIQQKKLQNQLQEMATGTQNNAEEVAGTSSSSRQVLLERSATGEDLQLAIPEPPQQDAGEPSRPAEEKRKQRHSVDQIQRMEAVFKECMHPNYMQRLRLSEELGLTPQQVLFWFQNRRTQLRVQQNRAENAMLLEEHERLNWENNRLKADMNRLSCPRCSFSTWLQQASPESRQLFFENARLREQIEKISRITAMYGVPPTN